MTSVEQFWITTVAVLLSPLLAVQVQRFLDSLRDKKARRESVFYSLMSTRAARVSAEHVIALNRIDIEWFGFRFLGIHRRSQIENEVLGAWKIYLDHLNTPAESVGGLNVWGAKGDELFTDLLYVIAKSLGYSFDKVALKRGAYSPVAHGQLEMEQTELRKMLVEWLKGTRSVKVDVNDGPGNSGA